MWGKPLRLDNRRSKEVLGINYMDTKQTVVEMAASMIESGIIPEKRGQKK